MGVLHLWHRMAGRQPRQMRPLRGADRGRRGRDEHLWRLLERTRCEGIATGRAPARIAIMCVDAKVCAATAPCLSGATWLTRPSVWRHRRRPRGLRNECSIRTRYVNFGVYLLGSRPKPALVSRLTRPIGGAGDHEVRRLRGPADRDRAVMDASAVTPKRTHACSVRVQRA